MKINDKQLVYFASSKLNADLEGWLWKKGELNTSYQKRWCVLKGNLFFYFDRKNDKEPIGVIILENSFVQLTEGGDSPYTFSIHFTGEGSRVYKLTADDHESCVMWIKALSVSSYRYLKILVDGLERDVRNLKENQSHENLLAQKNKDDKSQSFFSYVTEDDDSIDQHTQMMRKCSSLSNLSASLPHYHEEEFLDFNIFPTKNTSKLSKAKSYDALQNQQSSSIKHGKKKYKTKLRKVSSSLSRVQSSLTKKITTNYENSQKVSFAELHEMFRKEIANFLAPVG